MSKITNDDLTPSVTGCFNCTSMVAVGVKGLRTFLFSKFLFYTHFITIVMPPGPVSCKGGTKYPHCIVLHCIVSAYPVHQGAVPRRNALQIHLFTTSSVNMNLCYNETKRQARKSLLTHYAQCESPLKKRLESTSRNFSLYCRDGREH